MNRFKRIRKRGHLRSLLWTILIALFFFRSRELWWIGAIMILGSLFSFFAYAREARTPETPPSPPVETFTPPPPPKADSSPQAAVVPPSQNLPSNCANCGAPVRAAEVHWHGTSAGCAYCGSTLKMES
ncbi:MAG: hypothetical protein LC099_08400 [Anaerolineales bacterium]|nr:hypothetical protein [Anaerolineales bacterium]